jgi:hypothetical protein
VRSNTSPDKWYVAKENGYVGPFTLEELRVKLAAHPNSAEALVWCHHFSHWKRASDVDELLLLGRPTPPLPHSSLVSREVDAAFGTLDWHKFVKNWHPRWWWLIAALPILALLSVKVVVGNSAGRSTLERLHNERRSTRKTL